MEGLAARQFVLHYQPIFTMGSGGVARLEALCRWDHPQRGRLAPADFIDLTEHDGVGAAFTEAVLSQAMADCVSWRADGLNAGVAVNVSPRLLVDLGIPTVMDRLLGEHGLEPAHLTIEITEGAAGVAVADIGAAVAELAAAGVRVSLDDFGCADSSLERLQTLALDELKIDRRFITQLPDNKTDATIVSFIAGLGRELGLEVVAEGIEHPGALAFLRQASIGYVQGFHLARPQPLADIYSRGWPTITAE